MLTEPIRCSSAVIEAINGEFTHQASLHDAGRADTEDHGVAGQLVTLDVYTRQALDAWAKNAGEAPALEELRKVAAIAIRALELYGCPTRDGCFILPIAQRQAELDQLQTEARQ